MQKINFILPTISEILNTKNPAIWLAKCIFAFNWRTRFFMACSFNRIIKVIMVHNLNPKNLYTNGLLFPSLQNQNNSIFCSVFGQYPKNYICSQIIWPCHFLHLRHPDFMRSFWKILWAVLKKMCLPTDIGTLSA